MIYKTYITFASWEERFFKSFNNDIKNHSFERIIILRFTNGHHLNMQNKTIEQVKSLGVKLEIKELTFGDDIKNWKFFKHELFNFGTESFNNTLLNISTMPRNIIYYLLHFLKELSIPYHCLYYKATKHSYELTKNPLQPSLILQHSGLFDLEKPTLLITCVGYDEKRVFQLYNYFEPKETLLLVEKEHKSEVDLNTKFNFCLINEKTEYQISSFIEKEIYNTLKNIYDAKHEEYNILLCSLGPKISTIEFFEFQYDYPSCGLVYVASKDYCENYSNGIDLNKPIIK